MLSNKRHKLGLKVQTRKLKQEQAGENKKLKKDQISVGVQAGWCDKEWQSAKFRLFLDKLPMTTNGLPQP